MNEARPPTHDDIVALRQRQLAYFEEGHTLPRAFREAQLKRLIEVVQDHERAIGEALQADFRKPELETWAAETSMVVNEARHAIKHLGAWMKPQRWMSPLVAQPARSALYAHPLGSNLIIGAWNYPVQLTLQPLVAALAAGNVAVVKPSEVSPHASAVVARIIGEAFDPQVVACVQGGIDTSEALLAQPWAHIFFTGGPKVGRIVAHAAAEHLSRVTLELGGKSPVYVGRTANLDTAAARIAWGKWINAGQTCVAPDHILVHEDVHDAFVAKLCARITEMYGDDPQASPDFARIIHEGHVKRLAAMLQGAQVAAGGVVDVADRYVAPTVLTGVKPDDAVMQEEIFGPILPVLQVGGLAEARRIIARHPNPLAFYIFTEDAAEREQALRTISFGGGCSNNVALHLADPGLPFGGVGTSGTGAYHGKHGFDRFTHHKAVLESHSAKLLDLPLKYAPYEGKLDKLKWILG